jgi:hypothetical protein
MAPTISFQPVTIATITDSEGRLVLMDGALAGVLVLLDDEMHGRDHGMWFLEAAFGPLEEHAHKAFSSLDEAARCFRKRARQA